MTRSRVLLTGATGCFGRRLAVELLERGCELVLVVRGRDDADARRRAHSAIGASHPSVRVLRGDVSAPGLGLIRRHAAIARSVDVVVHAAAVTDFGLTLAEARAANVDGTRHVLELAETLPGLDRLVYVSTAFVAGRRCGRVRETQLRHDAGFVTAYERSKHEAELLVRSAGVRVPVTILRPSVVAEPRDERGLSALWFVLRLIERGLVPVLPGAPGNTLDVIPAAEAATASAGLVMNGAVGTFHVAGGDRAPRVAEIVRTATGRSVRFVDRTAFPSELARLRRRHPSAARSYDALAGFIELLAYPKVFDTTRAEAALGRTPCDGDPLDTFRSSAGVLGSVAR